MIISNNVCNGGTHVIKEGDTLYKISRMHNVPLGELLDANSKVNIYNLKVGDTICIPEKNDMPILPPNTNTNMNKWFVYMVKDGDTLENIMKDFEVNIDDLMEANSQNNIMLKPGSVVVVPGNM